MYDEQFARLFPVEVLERGGLSKVSDDVSMSAMVSVFPEEDPLPGAEGELSIDNGDG